MIFLHTALAEEARPLIARFGLRTHGPGLFPLYRGELAGAAAWLVIAGVGKVRAAAAVAYAHAVADAPGARAWLNVGVAGHADLEPGSVRLAHTVCDRAAARRWYPSLSLLGATPACALTSVDAPETGFPDQSLYDMEAAGFYPIALASASAELVHCLKIVSDNRANPASQLTGAGIEQRVSDNAGAVADCAATLAGAAARLPHPASSDPAVVQLLGSARFSATQRLRLARLVQRWRVLAPERDPLHALPSGPRGSRELLLALEAGLRALRVRFPAP